MRLGDSDGVNRCGWRGEVAVRVNVVGGLVVEGGASLVIEDSNM